jgi:hypothetical protein
LFLFVFAAAIAAIGLLAIGLAVSKSCIALQVRTADPLTPLYKRPTDF